MMFVDASALITILCRGPEADALLDRLGSGSAMTSGIAIYEATVGLARVQKIGLLDALQTLREFLTAADIRLVPIGGPEAIAAIEAFARFGKGQGHPAELNMGDCFSFGCAQVHGLPLLHDGGSFTGTPLK
jgi:ribonuclease VapC